MKRSLLLLPGPVTVAQPILEAMARPMFNHRDAEFGALLGRVDRALKPVLGTGGLDAAIANSFSPGSRLLSCSLGAFGERFAAIARTYGCIVESLDAAPGDALDTSALAARLDADRDRAIAGILLTH